MVALGERFAKLLRPRNVKAVEQDAPTPPTPQELLEGRLRDLATNDEHTSTVLDWLDECIARAEVQVAASIQNHPVMCHYHGQVTVLKSLKLYLNSLKE